MMQALRFHSLGSLGELKIEDVARPTPVLGGDEVLVRIHAAAVNPSDVKNVLGKMAQTTFPRTPGRDFAGMVAAGPDDLLGKEVFGTGGDLGFQRDGTHAEFVLVPRVAVLPKPARLAFAEAAAVGVGYLTAWAALVSAANLRAGETVLITGAAGAVGSAAARIARRIGARVLGAVRRRPADAEASAVDEWIGLETEPLPEAALARTGGRGADVVLDTVGGALFEPCLRSLAHRGRQVAISASSDPRVSLHLADFYHREARLFGVDTLALGFAECAEALHQLTPGFEDGSLPPPALQTFPLARAAEAYALVESGRAKTKIVLVP